MKLILKQLRAKQWVKNLFVFIPLFVAGEFGNLEKLLRTLVAFAFFCAASSMIYVINDLVDLEKDRLHPEKSKRPLASGRLSVSTGWILVAVLGIVALPLQWIWLPAALPFIGAYIIQNFAYSYFFKKVAILDVTFIAVGFVLRVLTGVAVNGLPFSHWLIIMTFTIAMLLGLGKRKGEILLDIEHKNKRAALDGYNTALIDALQMIFTTVTIVVYIMYTFFNENFAAEKRGWVFYSTLFVVLGLMRYLQLSMVFRRTENPTEILLKDRFMLFTVLAWVVYLGFITYFV